eukprot:g78985.t1
MALRIRVFGLYRSAIRQQRKTFANDFEAQRLAMDDIRRLFREGSSETDPAKINKMIEETEQAIEFLRWQVVQGKRNSKTGNYALEIPKDKADKLMGRMDGVPPPAPPTGGCGRLNGDSR